MNLAIPTPEQLQAELESVRERLAEAEETLAAIRGGGVDALVVTGPQGERLYTLSGAVEPYRILIEEMNQGAATLSADGVILYCNRRFAELLRVPLERAIGSALASFVLPQDQPRLRALLQTGCGARAADEMTLQTPTGATVPVRLAASGLSTDGGAVACLVATDLTDERNRELILRNMIEDVEHSKQTVDAERHRFFDVLETLTPMICLLTRDYHVAFANRAFRERFGEARGRHCYEYCFGRSAPCDFCESFRVLETGQPHHWEVNANGSVIDVHNFPFTDADGVPMVLEMDVDITERRKNEEELRLLDDLVRQSPLPFVMTSVEGPILRFNPAYERLTGYSAEELHRLTYQQLTPERWHEMETRQVEQMVATGRPVIYEKEYQRKDGSVVPLQLVVDVHRDPAGKPVHYYAFITDITERKRTEEALQKEKLLTDSIVNNVPAGIAYLDNNFILRRSNPAYAEFINSYCPFTPEQAVGMSYFDFVPGSRPQLEHIFQQVRDNAKTTNLGGFALVTSRGGRNVTSYWNASIAPLKNPEGIVQGILLLAQDVTEKAAAEKAVQQASAYNRTLIETSLDPLVTISPEGKITDVNEATIKATGRPRQALLGTDFTDYFTEPETARAGYKEVLAKGFVTDYPLTIRHRDGGLTDVLYNASLYRDAQANVLGVFAAARDITESKRVLRDLAETKDLFDNILQSSTKYSIIGKDLDCRIQFWNEGAQRNYGYTADEIIGRRSDILHTPEDLANGAVDRMLKTAFKNGTVEGEFQRVRKDGSQFLASVVVTRRNDVSGRPIGYLLVSTDITERKRTERALRESEERYRALVAATSQIVWITDPDGSVQDIPMFRAFTGQSIEEVRGARWAEALHPDDRAPTLARWHQAVENRSFFDIEYRLRRHDGEYRFFNSRGVPVLNEDGSIREWVGLCVDITERKHAQKVLEQANAYNRSLIEASLDPLVTIGADGKITDVNAATEAATGCSRSELVGADFSNYFTEPEKARDGYQQAFREGLVRDYPLELKHRDGRIMSVRYNSSVFRDASGQAAGVFAAARDITERKRAQDALARSEHSLSEAQRMAHLGSWDLDLATREVLWSNETFRIYGWPQREGAFPVAQSMAMNFAEDQPAVDEAFRSALASGKPLDVEHRIRRQDGTMRWVRCRAEVQRDDAGNPRHIAGTVLDITEQKCAQEAIAELNRGLEQRVRDRTSELETANKELEAFAYSVSHDLRAPLRGIDGFSRLLLEKQKDKLDAKGQDHLQRIRAGTQRMGQLIDDLLMLSAVTRGEINWQPLDLSQLAQVVVGELQKENPERHVEWSIAPDLCAHGDAHLLSIVLENLLRNAWKFTGRQAAPKIEFGVTQRNGTSMFFVRDNGAGFNMAYADKLFGPFQRLHSTVDFPGTGIGLALVQRVIHRHRGTVEAEGEVGRGATFYFTLPTSKENHNENQNHSARGRQPG